MLAIRPGPALSTPLLGIGLAGRETKSRPRRSSGLQPDRHSQFRLRRHSRFRPRRRSWPEAEAADGAASAEGGRGLVGFYRGGRLGCGPADQLSSRWPERDRERTPITFRYRN